MIQNGIVNNRYKTFYPGKTVVSFCFGTQKLYDFVDMNSYVEFYLSTYVNKPANIVKNDNMVAINNALEVDLSGQVVSDSIGNHFYSGIGGQVGFVTGASKSKNGKPIIALPSRAKNGEVSRIVATLQGKSVRERVLELIRVAHPQFRDDLLAQIRKKIFGSRLPNKHSNRYS